VLIGQVTDFSHAGGRGLGYVGGSYFSLGLEQEMDSEQPTICGAIIRSGDAVLMERRGTTHSPVHIAGAEPGGQRLRLAQGLADRGIEARLQQVYSSFNDATTKLHYTFFLAASAGAATPEGTEWIAIEHLPNLTYATPSVGHMMTRFALEAREGDFSLYLGDADRGELHSFDKGAG
jgi:hypothetical protein